MDNMITVIASCIAGIIFIGGGVRITILGINMMSNPDDRSAYINEIKNVIIVVVVSLIVTGSAPLLHLILRYIK